MKTITFLISIIALTISTSSFASINEPTAETTTTTMSKSRISEIITSEIAFPDALAKEITEGFVAVSISFDDNDQLVIEGINASNKSLQTYVSQQLKKIIIINASKTIDRIIDFKFNFYNKKR